ncbi:hypothetical protein BH11PSE11_BH11PSE11_19700 [soil metagenome]
MNILYRAQIGFVTAVVVVGLLVIFDIIFSFDIGAFIFSYIFVGAVFLVSYVLAPKISRYLPYDRTRRTENENVPPRKS